MPNGLVEVEAELNTNPNQRLLRKSDRHSRQQTASASSEQQRIPDASGDQPDYDGAVFRRLAAEATDFAKNRLCPLHSSVIRTSMRRRR